MIYLYLNYQGLALAAIKRFLHKQLLKHKLDFDFLLVTMLSCAACISIVVKLVVIITFTLNHLVETSGLFLLWNVDYELKILRCSS